MSFDDKTLIEGCQKGERKFQQALYDKYNEKMYLVALRYSKMEQEAEDVLQEAFIKIFNKIKTIREKGSLTYWIKQVVVNTALNYQRSKLYLYPMIDVVHLSDCSIDETVITNIHYKELLNMVRELPTGCQVIFNLFAIEGYKHQEIAKMLKISESTSKSQYSRAKAILIKKLTNRERIKYESGKF